MKKLIAFFISMILLALSFVSLNAPKVVSYGKGNGKDAKIVESVDFSNLLSSTTKLYRVSEKSFVKNKYKSTTLDVSTISNYESEQYSLKTSGNSTFYITEDAVLISGVATIHVSSLSGSNSISGHASVYVKGEMEIYLDKKKELVNIHDLTVYTYSNFQSNGQNDSFVFPNEYRDRWLVLDQNFNDTMDSFFGIESMSDLMGLNLTQLNYFGEYFLDNKNTKFDEISKAYSLRSTYWDDFVTGLNSALKNSTYGANVDYGSLNEQPGNFSINLSNATSPEMNLEYNLRFYNINNTVVKLLPEARFSSISEALENITNGRNDNGK